VIIRRSACRGAVGRLAGVRQATTKDNITKVEMARRMRTSRAALDRLLDPGSGAVTLQTLSRAANAVGYGLRIELV
jgi:antitoxin HicB